MLYNTLPSLGNLERLSYQIAIDFIQSGHFFLPDFMTAKNRFDQFLHSCRRGQKLFSMAI